MSPRNSNRDPDFASLPGSSLPTSLRRLEDRIVLDAAADGGDSHAGPPPPAEPVAPTHPAEPGAPADVPHRVLLVSDAVEGAHSLADAAADGTEVVLFDPTTTSLEALLDGVRDAAEGRPLDSVAFATHGMAGAFELVADLDVDTGALQNPELQAFWRGVASLLSPGGRIDLFACELAANDDGLALLGSLENLTGANFAGSTDMTGNASVGGDWVLETDDGATARVYFDADDLLAFDGTLATPPNISHSGASPGPAVGGEAAVNVGSGISLAYGTSGEPMGAAVWIKGFVAGEDQLSWDVGEAAARNIGVAANIEGNGVLLSPSGGSPTLADYEAVLRTVEYQNTSMTPDTTPREIVFVLGDTYMSDGLRLFRYAEETGHYYTMVDVNVPRATAESNALSDSMGGLQGYLATIRMVPENVEVAAAVSGLGFFEKAWIGGNDLATEGTWYWQTPDADVKFWEGGAVGEYANWQGGVPTGVGDYLTFVNTAAQWTDVDNTQFLAYVVEFGGLPTDTDGTIAAIVSIDVEEPNAAPVLDNSGAMTLDAIAEDAFSNGGTSVADMIASAGGDRITDANGDPEGLALVGYDGTHGGWQFSTDGGATWHDIGAVSDANALLLRDSDLLRFRPDADWHGSVAAGLTFRAWDQTSGTAGAYADASATGGQSAFSTATETAAITVTPLNDAPILATAGPFTLSPISEDDVTNGGTTIADLLASAGDPIDDVDAGALQGVAITSLDSSHGTWQYSADGGATWHDLGAVSENAALLLRSSDLVRLQPEADWNGPLNAALSFRAWDQSSGVAGTFVDTTTSGGTSAFSTAVANAAIDVAAVNDAPTLAIPLADQSTASNSPFSFDVPAAAFDDVDAGDSLSLSATLADGSSLPSWLAFDPLTRRFSAQPGHEHIGAYTIKLTATDNAGASVSDEFVLTILNGNHAPELATPLADQLAPEGAVFGYQLADGSFVDADAGDELTYSATLSDGSPLPNWLTFDPETRTFHGTPGFDDVGVLNVRVTADDGFGGTATGLFALTVTRAYTPPAPEPGHTPTPTPRNGPGDSGSTADGSSTTADGGDGTSTGSAEGGSTTTVDGGENAGSAESADVGDNSTGDGNAGEASDSGDGAASGGETGEAAGPEAGSDGVDAGGEPSVAAATGNPSDSGGGHTARHRDLDDELPILSAANVNAELRNGSFTSDLLADQSQPSEFRDAWNSIITAYSDTSEEVSTYLQSAFRAVTESALIYQATEEPIAALREEIARAHDAGLVVNEAELLREITAARNDVRVASTELERAILSAAQAGSAEHFDRVLEDVIVAALDRLMQANESLFIESHAVVAVTAALRDARVAGTGEPDPAALADSAHEARAEARAEFAEMRKRWDGVAQDVFAAFVERLVTEKDVDPKALPPIEFD